jgi:hypothetical protein
MKTLDEAMQLLVMLARVSQKEIEEAVAEIGHRHGSILQEAVDNEKVQALCDCMAGELHAVMNSLGNRDFESEEKRSAAMSEAVRLYLASAFGTGVMIGIHMERQELPVEMHQ